LDIADLEGVEWFLGLTSVFWAVFEEKICKLLRGNGFSGRYWAGAKRGISQGLKPFLFGREECQA
jgi:hypothetical protein